MAIDFDQESWKQLKSIVEMQRIEYKESVTNRQVLTAEIDNAEALEEKFQAIEGARTLCHSKIIAFSGQQAQLEVSEPGPDVQILPGGTNTSSRPHNQSQIL